MSHLNEHGITHLRHVDLAVPDYETQRDLLQGHLGPDRGRHRRQPVLLRRGGLAGAVRRPAAPVRPEAARPDLVRLPRARRPSTRWPRSSAAEGVQLVGEPDELQTAGGGYGFRFFDIDGRTIEICADVETRQHRAIEEGEAIPVRISHAVMNSNDPNKTRDFYANVLGFKLSDTLWSEHMGEMMHFMRCNDWHHSLAIAKGPHTSVHHVSFEMRGLDEYMRGTGRVMRAGIKKIWGPGRHNAGNNTFSYFLDPSGNTMEYTTELEKIETDEWHPSVYDIADPMTQDVWGTADPMSEIIARDSFNDPDQGVFVAPPV